METVTPGINDHLAATAHMHARLESSAPSVRRINVGTSGWKYFWPASKPSYTHPRPLSAICPSL